MLTVIFGGFTVVHRIKLNYNLSCLFDSLFGRKRGILNYIEFVEAVKESLSAKIGSSYDVVIKKVTKNNDVCRHGLSLFRKELKDNKKVSRIVYLEDFYREYCENQDYTVESVSDELYNLLSDFKPPKFNETDYTDITKVKDRIIFELVNYEMNKERLYERPYMKIMDLAIIFAFIATDLGRDFGVVHITNQIAEQFGLNNDDLWEIAKLNTPRLLKADISSLFSIIPDDNLKNKCEAEFEDMFIICNNKKTCGAGVILYDKVLENISKTLDSDLYILPSSIHETIVIKATKDKEVAVLEEMVQNINRTVVSTEDILSDKIYSYTRESKKLEIA